MSGRVSAVDADLWKKKKKKSGVRRLKLRPFDRGVQHPGVTVPDNNTLRST